MRQPFRALSDPGHPMQPVHPTRRENPSGWAFLFRQQSRSWAGSTRSPLFGRKADGLTLVFSGMRFNAGFAVGLCSFLCLQNNRFNSLQNVVEYHAAVLADRKAADLLEEHFRNWRAESMVDLRFHLAVKHGQTVRRVVFSFWSACQFAHALLGVLPPGQQPRVGRVKTDCAEGIPVGVANFKTLEPKVNFKHCHYASLLLCCGGRRESRNAVCDSSCAEDFFIAEIHVHRHADIGASAKALRYDRAVGVLFSGECGCSAEKAVHMKNGELAQLCNGVAALDVEKLCAQFLPTADGTGVKVELRLCGAYLRVGNAENVGRLVRVVIECYACILYAAAKKLPLFGFTGPHIYKNHFELTVGLKAVRKIDSSCGIRHGYASSKIS
nr:MAG TPA: hypothetical protein [Caudoviricetes sp.]